MKYDLEQMLEEIRREEVPAPASASRGILSQDEIRKLAASRRRRKPAAPAMPEAAADKEET